MYDECIFQEFCLNKYEYFMIKTALKLNLRKSFFEFNIDIQHVYTFTNLTTV